LDFGKGGKVRRRNRKEGEGMEYIGGGRGGREEER